MEWKCNRCGIRCEDTDPEACPPICYAKDELPKGVSCPMEQVHGFFDIRKYLDMFKRIG